MTNQIILDALALPPEARVERRVPKKLLLEQGAPTSVDRRRIQDGIEDLVWIAALKPSNVGVPAFRDETRDYSEIAVLSVTMRPKAKVARLIELVHRAIPYPLVLVTAQDGGIALSLAHKRFSQAEAARVVAEDVKTTPLLHLEEPVQAETAFLASLPVSRQVSGNLFTLYQGWMDRITALAAARITGTFGLPANTDGASTRREALDEYGRLEREIATLRAQAAKERQLNRRVDLNLETQRLEATRAEAAANL